MGDYKELFDNLSHAYEQRAVRGLVEAGENLDEESARKFHSALIDAVHEVNQSGPSHRILGILPHDLYLLAMTKFARARAHDGAV